MATTTDEIAADPLPPASHLWWSVPMAAFLLLVIVAMIIGAPAMPGGQGTSHDASDLGFRAAFLILEELHYPVERSRRPTGGAVRWVLFPKESKSQDVAALDGWVQRGGVMLLADDQAEFAEELGLQLDDWATANGVRHAVGLDVDSLSAGETAVEVVGGLGQPWDGVRVDGKPLITIVPHGAGAIWVLLRPDVLRNQHLRHPGNAVLTCRLAEAMLAERPGQLAFDEFYHGLRERPSVTALLLRPPMLAVTVQAIVLTAVLLWYYMPRFGPLRPVPPPARRSKEEFLDAVAVLLRRKGDYADAFRTVRHDLLRRIEADLGVPAGTPLEQTVHEAERRRGIQPEPLLALLTAPGPAGNGPQAFLDALHQLETARHDYFDRRPRHR